MHRFLPYSSPSLSPCLFSHSSETHFYTEYFSFLFIFSWKSYFAKLQNSLKIGVFQMRMWHWHLPCIFPYLTSFAVWKSPSFPFLSVVIHNDGYFYNPFKSSYQSTDFLWCYAVQSDVVWQTYFCGIDHLCYSGFLRWKNKRVRVRDKEEEEGISLVA